MDAGGRLEMYKLMDMEPPAMKVKKQKTVPKLVIDRKGDSDPARYKGLKMAQVLDDNEMARALEEANRKRRKGESMRPKLEEESFVKPFAGMNMQHGGCMQFVFNCALVLNYLLFIDSENRNVGPRQTPNWTPEMLDEEGRKRGKALAWARKAKAGEFVKDPYETLVVDGSIRLYSIFAATLIAFAFGRATPVLFEMLNAQEIASVVQQVAQVPAVVVILAAVGSSVVNSVKLAPEKNRSQFVWGFKGLVGGPVAITELRSLDTLQTRGEMEAAEEQANA